MPILRPLIYTTLLLTPPTYYATTTLHRLESTYTPLPPPTHSHPSLLTPTYPSHRTTDISIYGAQIPLSLLRQEARRQQPLGAGAGVGSSTTGSAGAALQEAWARHFLASPALRMEGRAASGFLLRSAGDCGEEGLRVGQELLNGVLRVVVAPGAGAGAGAAAAETTGTGDWGGGVFARVGGAGTGRTDAAPLVVRWEFPERIREACKRVAGWGYPWRFMSGGRHEVSVGEVGRDAQGREVVEVRFGSAHDYEVVREEGEGQKRIPEWTARLHRAYAMWLLDERVRALQRGEGNGAGFSWLFR